MTSCVECAHVALPKGERGQVLALLLLLWAAMLGGLLFVFNSGQIVTAKVRLIGAADAAAYSAATWEARALNFQAYMNRGIVANEVATAQLVSLRSWSAYMDQIVREASWVGTVAPPLAAPLQALARSWGTLNAGLQRSLPLLEGASSRWNVEVLARAENFANAETPAIAADLASRVAVDNVPELGSGKQVRAFALEDAGRWIRLSDTHGRSGEQRQRLREVVMASRDGFSRERGWTLGLPSLVSVKKRGGTDLLGYDSWRGLDTAALHVNMLFSSVEQPLAWGAAENRHRPEQLPGDFGGSYRDNPETSAVATELLAPRNGYAGLPPYRDVHLERDDSRERLRYEIEVRQPAATISTSDVIMGAATVVPGEEPKPASPAYHSDAAFALSAAQVWFTRPVGRADRRQELANLFNPYWQARLAPVTHAQRAVAAGIRGGAPDPYLVLP
jgi:hypothetical protein